MYEMFTDKIEHIIRESISELKPEKRNKLFEGYMESLVRYCELIKKYSNTGLPNDERVKAEYRQIDRTMRFIEESLTRDEVELAQKLGVSKGIISLWENGLREPTMNSLIEMAKFFDVSIDYLVGLSN